MLSIEELRKSLNRPNMSDEQVAEIRDALYCFARIFVEGYLRERPSPQQE
jgi:hypothetical protein